MKRKRLILSLILFGLWAVLPEVYGKPAYSANLETFLRKELFNTYEVLQRPQNQMFISMSLTILTVNDMSIKDQALSISGYLNVAWADDRLDWSNSSATVQDYSNVKFLFSTEEYVWRPALIIENSVNDISIISDKTIPMRITSRGIIYWNPSGIYVVSCESDTTYYPLDSQECSIKVSSWAYTSTEVHLTLGDPPIDLSFYSANGEWDLIGSSGTKSGDKTRGSDSFSSLTFTVKLQRRPMFHILNTLFPVALMALLIAMVFKLDVESGEKIGFALTVLLAYAVYLTMISDNIPSTSVTVCYLSLYLAFIFSLGGISVVLTIFVLSLHHKPEEDEIPRWVKSLTNTVLLKMALMKSCGKCCRNSKVTEVASMSDKTEIKKLKLSEKCEFPIVEATEDKNGDGITWHKLSVIMDRVFFNIYLLLIIMSTSMLLMVIFIHYSNA